MLRAGHLREKKHTSHIVDHIIDRRRLVWSAFEILTSNLRQAFL